MSSFQTSLIPSKIAALLACFKDLRVQLEKVHIYASCISIIATRKEARNFVSTPA